MKRQRLVVNWVSLYYFIIYTMIHLEGNHIQWNAYIVYTLHRLATDSLLLFFVVYSYFDSINTTKNAA